MSWTLKRYTDGRYRMWSTIVDAYLTPALSRDKMIKFIAESWRRDLRTKIEVLKEDFPGGWIEKDTRRRISYTPRGGPK